MTPSDFHPGDHVRYIPGHAHGDRHHPDCEDGVVSSTNDRYVFVKFSLLALNGQACDSADLVKLMPATPHGDHLAGATVTARRGQMLRSTRR